MPPPRTTATIRMTRTLTQRQQQFSPPAKPGKALDSLGVFLRAVGEPPATLSKAELDEQGRAGTAARVAGRTRLTEDPHDGSPGARGPAGRRAARPAGRPGRAPGRRGRTPRARPADRRGGGPGPAGTRAHHRPGSAA